ncbi:Retrovirus-related Pol polyprotein from transposon 17.6 [Nosema granulosis]|uniref:Retrovirus-related Pol polyprotein from transposon 17.6 n=1 Tax=Nosema granulosis TaxID=83296 RepID=A0A9P6KY71_9MICR|nr:Retrovirus-related Pol polyprotein from transposon 17.6 [Nosema granulosis]
MVSAFKKNLDKCQRNYSVADKELLALVKGIENYRHCLLGRPFKLRIDHKALTYLWETNFFPGRLLRWSLKLAEYDSKVEYIKGENNISDGCSRAIGEETVCRIFQEELTRKEIDEILENYHQKSGHGSPNNMKFMISQRYRWNRMYRDIENHCSNCLICIRVRNEITNKKNKVIQSDYPDQLWEVDLAGKIDESDGPKFIFVEIDHYTKWIETRVLERKSASEIAKAVEELIIKKHGIPERILSDDGLEFNNQDVRTLQEEYNFSWDFG